MSFGHRSLSDVAGEGHMELSCRPMWQNIFSHTTSLAITHNLGVFVGGGLVLSIITGLFGINVDGIPGAEESAYAFALFTSLLVLLGVLLRGIGLLYLGLKKPIVDEDVEVRKLELQEVVKMFQQEAESHAQVRKTVPPTNPTAARRLPDGADYFLIN